MAGRVLLLEDDPLVRELVQVVLAAEGCQVSVCDSVQSLRAAARAAEPPPLALVDPWGDSYRELAEAERREIRELAGAVPTIMLTARDWATRTSAEELGLLALVPTPFDVFELAALVKQSVQRLRLDSQAARAQSTERRALSRDALKRLHQARHRLD